MTGNIELLSQYQKISAISKLNGVLIILLISTFRLPVLFAGNLGLLLNIIFILALLLLIILRLPDIFVIRNVNKIYLRLIIFFVIWGQMAELRTLLNGHYEAFFVFKVIVWQWLIIMVALGMVTRLKNKQELEFLLRSLIIGASLYLIVNLGLALLGVKSADYVAPHDYDLRGAILTALEFDILLMEL